MRMLGRHSHFSSHVLILINNIIDRNKAKLNNNNLRRLFHKIYHIEIWVFHSTLSYLIIKPYLVWWQKKYYRESMRVQWRVSFVVCGNPVVMNDMDPLSLTWRLFRGWRSQKEERGTKEREDVCVMCIAVTPKPIKWFLLLGAIIHNSTIL